MDQATEGIQKQIKLWDASKVNEQWSINDATTCYQYDRWPCHFLTSEHTPLFGLYE